MAAFTGFTRDAFAWFAGLEDDHPREDFTATPAVYDEPRRGALTALLDELADVFGGDPRVARQHRDLRFTPDKTPYKTRTYGLIRGAEIAPGGLYAELSARGLYAGSG